MDSALYNLLFWIVVLAVTGLIWYAFNAHKFSKEYITKEKEEERLKKLQQKAKAKEQRRQAGWSAEQIKTAEENDKAMEDIHDMLNASAHIELFGTNDKDKNKTLGEVAKKMKEDGTI